MPEEITFVERIIIESEENNELKLEHLARYDFAKQYVKNNSVLDVACGTGYGSFILAKSGAKNVIGLDKSVDAIEYAMDNYYCSPGLEFHLGDALNLSKYRQIQIIVSFETIEHLSTPTNFLDEVVKAMSVSGTFIVSTPNRLKGKLSDKPMNKFHHQEWSICEFERLLSSYFYDLQLFGQFFFFQKQRFPLSRTCATIVSKVIYPHLLKSMLKWQVSEFPPTTMFDVVPRYILAICRKPKV